MIRYIISLLLLMTCRLVSGAQNIDEILLQIEANNKTIQAESQQLQAADTEIRTQNNLEDPAIEYSPFFAKKEKGIVSSELVVRQGFDFPTLYFMRRKSGDAQRMALQKKYEGVRREVLLEAKNLCLDMIRLNQEAELLDARKKGAEHLLKIYVQRLEEGDATRIEVNKIKMERMNVQTEVAQNVAAHRAALQQLLALNGNMPLNFAEKEYPEVEETGSYDMLYDEIVSTDAALQEANANASAAMGEITVNRHQWLPKLELAYRRNTSFSESNNGFLIGGSIPLFSNRKKVKIAKFKASSAQLQLDNLRLQIEAEVQSKYNEMVQLREALEVYDVELMKATLALLDEAVESGEMSLTEYYVEADNVYKNYQSYVNLNYQYQRLLSEIYKNRL